MALFTYPLGASEQYYLAGKQKRLIIQKGVTYYGCSYLTGKPSWIRLERLEYLGPMEDWEEITEAEAREYKWALEEGLV